MNQEQENNLITSATLFIKTLTEIEGADNGIALWERIAEVIDPAIKGKIFFSLLTNNFGKIILQPLHPLESQDAIGNKVSIIRCIRNYTGLGLKDALDIFNKMLKGESVQLSVDPKDTLSALIELRTYGIKA